MLVPCLTYVVVHADGGGFIQSYIHRLARETSSYKMCDEVLRDLAEAFGPGQKGVLLAESPSELALCCLVEFCCLQKVLEFYLEILVDELQLWDSVLVVERNCRSVFDGGTEVVY